MGSITGSKRAERRHHRDRMKAKARRIASQSAHLDPDNFSKLHDHLAYCSCHMCGNPRKHWNELTMQERRQEAVLKEALKFA